MRELRLRNLEPPDFLRPFLLLLPALLVCFLFFSPALRSGTVDYRNLYVAGYIVRSGQAHSIYDLALQNRLQNELVSPAAVPLPFIRPAFEALLFAPFSYLPFRASYFAFFLFNLLLIIVLLVMIRPWLVHIRSLDPALPNLLLLFMPLIVAILQGQDSILLAVLLAAAVRALRKDAAVISGTLVALGLFKMQMVLPIFLLMLLWRRWRFCAGFAATAAILSAISIALAGPAATATYLGTMIGLGKKLGFVLGPSLDMSLMANLHGAIAVLLRGTGPVVGLTVAASILTLIVAAFERTLSAEGHLLFAIPIAALVSYYMYVHDMSVLLIPAIAALDVLATRKPDQVPYRRLAFASVAALLVAPMIFLFVPKAMWLAVAPLVLFSFVSIKLQKLGPAPEPSLVAASS